MREQLQILKGVAGTIVSSPPIVRPMGKITAVTVTVQTPSTDGYEAADSAAFDATDVTLSEAAERDADDLTLARDTTFVSSEFIADVGPSDVVSGTVDNIPMVPGTLQLLTDEGTFSDDADGTWPGDDTGSINYATGQFSFNYAEDFGENADLGEVSARYSYYHPKVAPGRPLLVGDNEDDYRPELVRVVGVEGNDEAEATLTVSLAEPLRRSFASGALVYGWSVEVGLSPEQTATRGRVDLRFEATIGGETVRWVETAHIVDWPIFPPIDTSNLGQHCPESWLEENPEDDDGSEAIRIAWWDIVVPALSDWQIDWWSIRDMRALAPVHAAAIHLHLVENSRRVDEEFVRRVREIFQERLHKALNRADTWVDTDA